MSKPPQTITPRDLSYQQAVAGQQAATEAQSAGMAPADLRALVHSSAPPVTRIRHHVLHGFSLQVILDLQLASVLFGGDLLTALTPVVNRFMSEPNASPTADELKLLARIAWIFTDPVNAYDYLQDALDEQDAKERKTAVRACDRQALDICGDWTTTELGEMLKHIVLLGKPAEAETPTPPETT